MQVKTVLCTLLPTQLFENKSVVQNHEIDLNILGCKGDLPEFLLAAKDQELFKSPLENNALRLIQIKLGLFLGW